MYQPPRYGFKECQRDIEAQPISLSDQITILPIRPADWGCHQGPFSDEIGLYAQTPKGWDLFFHGAYSLPETRIDRGGRKLRAVMYALDDSARVTVRSHGERIEVMRGYETLVTYSVPSERAE